MRTIFIKIRPMMLLLMLVWGVMARAAGDNYSNGVREGRVVVKFRNDKQVLEKVAGAAKAQARSGAVSLSGMPQLEKLAGSIKLRNIEPLFVMNPHFEARFRKEGLDRWYVIDYAGGQSPFAVVESLKGVSDVEMSEPNFEMIAPQYTVRMAEEVDAMVAAITASQDEYPVNDPRYPEQWHYNNTGQTGGTPGADINLVKAWKKRMDASSVIVAVMDQGVDHSHEDLRGNMWVNEAELYGLPGVDDDGNGVVDDIYGFDFGENYGTIEQGQHGTHVAGTVAAVSNNGIGVAGVAGGDGSGNGARIMTLPVFGSNQDRAANSFIYAADNGALISQNSWGFTSPGFESEAFAEAIRYFVKYAGCDANGNQLPGSLMKGGVVIFAAGNAASSGQYFPGCMDEVIGVASVNQSNQMTNYTNYDKWVDVACYGGETSVDNKRGVLSTYPNNRYAFLEGTSMACPHVSGVAALSLAELGGPGFTREMLTNYIVLTSRDNEKNYGANYKGKLGRGIVDAMNAMTRNDGVPPTAVTDLGVAMVADTYAQLRFTAPHKGDNEKVDSYRVEITDQDGNSVSRIFAETLMPGSTEVITLDNLAAMRSYRVYLVACDIWGVTSEKSNEVELTTFGKPGNLTYSKPGSTTTYKSLDYGVAQTMEVEIELYNNSREEQAGGLRWRADGYTSGHNGVIPASALRVKRMGYDAESMKMVPMGVAPGNKLRPRATGDSDDIFIQGGFRSHIHYRPNYYPDRYVGELKDKGVLKRSTAAQKIVVPESMTEGFVLSHMEFGMRVTEHWLSDDVFDTPKDLLTEFRIYRGGDRPRVENLIYSGNRIDMEDAQLMSMEVVIRPHFEAGEHFWIVMSMDERYCYPLGVNQDGENPEYSLYSSDNGETWSELSTVYTSVENPVFCIGALSDGSGARSHVRIEPSTGLLAKGEKQTIKAILDFTNVKEGIDTAMVFFNTDGTILASRRQLKIVTELTRNEVTPAFGEKLYDYGVVSVGDKVKKEVVVRNNGMGHMPVESVGLSNDKEFSIVSKLPAMIKACDSAVVVIEFAPQSLGAKNTTITVNGRGATASTLVMGTCVQAPEASLLPAEVTMNVTGNEVTQAEIVISNSSPYALKYEFGTLVEEQAREVRDVTLQIKSSAERTDTIDAVAGYVWVDNHMGKGYEGSPWVEISETGTELTGKVDGLKMYTRVELPFEFPYYGMKVRELMAGVNGLLRLYYTEEDLSVPVELPWVNDDDELVLDTTRYQGLIAPMWFADGSTGHFNTTRYFYQVMEDCVIFQYTGARVYWTMKGSEADFQVALYPDGSFEFRYKRMFEFDGVCANSFLIGWSADNAYDGKTIFYMDPIIASEVTPGYCIRVTPPAFTPFRAIAGQEYAGIVNPLSTKSVMVSVDAQEIGVGESVKELSITTNDPANKTLNYKVNFVKSDATSAEFTKKEYDFGDLIISEGRTEKMVQVMNTSKSDIRVRVALAADGNVELEDGTKEMTADIKKGMLKEIKVYVTGATESEIRVTNPEGTEVYSTSVIRAQDAGYRNLTLADLGVEALEYELNSGESKGTEITVNVPQGVRTRLYLPGFMKVETEGAAAVRRVSTGGDIDRFGYRWMNSAEENAPGYIWDDISKTGTKLELNMNDLYEGHDLPFSYKLYGVDYSKIYFSPSGRMSPFPLGFDVMYDFVSSIRMPDSSIPNPLISGMWARQWYNEQNKDAGIYYHINDERVIVQYHQFVFDWVTTNGFCSYQMILDKSGKVQFVYNDIENCDLSGKVTIGMQGVGQSDEVGYTYTLSGNRPIHNKTTVTAIPMYGPLELEPGKDVTIRFIADSYGYKGGEYNDSIIIVSDNLQMQTTLPVKMSVGTNAMLAARDEKIDFGNIIYGDTVEPMTLGIRNSGNTDLELESLVISGRDGERFAVKLPVTTEDNTNITTTYEEVKLPMRLLAFEGVQLAVFAEPVNENNRYEGVVEIGSTANDIRVELAAEVVKPAKLSIRDENGMQVMKLDLSGQTEAVEQKMVISTEDNDSELAYKLKLEVMNEPIPMPAMARAVSEKYPSTSYGMKPVKKPVGVNIEPQALNSIKPFASSGLAAQPYSVISVIKDVAPESMIGASGVGMEYGMACYVKMDTEDSGFLLSHVQMLTNTLGRDTSKVTIRVYNDCELPAREHLIYEKEHKLSMNVSLVGNLILPLEHNIAFAPNQKFWLEVYFAPKLEMPIAVAENPEGSDGTNYYRLYDAKKEKWQEFYNFDYLFAIYAVQESFSDLTRWLTMASDSGVMVANQSVMNSVTGNPIHLPVGSMSMTVNATTDKVSQVEPMVVEAFKFEEPQWTVFPEENMIILEGESLEFPIHAVDPDGLEVNYSLTSAVDGIRISTQADGSAIVRYTAPYTSGFVSNLNIQARTSRGVSVRRVSIGNINNNRAPVALSVKPITLCMNSVNQISLPVSYFFVDPDNDALSLSGSYSSEGISLDLTSNGLVITPRYEDAVDVTLVAYDGEFEATTRFRVNVVTGINNPPVLVMPFSSGSVATGTSVSALLEDHFMDPDGDELTFEAWASNDEIAEVSISDNSLSVLMMKPGLTAVAVKAMDGNQGETLATFEIMAIGETEDGAEDNDERDLTKLSVAPNPARERSRISLEVGESDAEYHCVIKDMNGRMMMAQQMNMMGDTGRSVEVTVSSFAPGVYLVQVMNGNEVISTEKLVVID